MLERDAGDLARAPLVLLQASSGRVDWGADGFAGDEKFHSSVLLPARGVIVGGNRQSVAEASGRN